MVAVSVKATNPIVKRLSFIAFGQFRYNFSNVGSKKRSLSGTLLPPPPQASPHVVEMLQQGGTPYLLNVGNSQHIFVVSFDE